MKNTINIALLILILCIGGFYFNHIILGTITAFGVGMNLVSFFSDKISLRNADFYVRITNSTSSISEILIIILAIALLTLSLLKDYLPLSAKDFLNDGMNLYFWSFTLSLVFSNYFVNFKNSVRSFNDGLLLPAERQLIDWNSINKIKIDKNRMVIDIQGNKHLIFQIDQRDDDDARKIKAQFEKYV